MTFFLVFLAMCILGIITLRGFLAGILTIAAVIYVAYWVTG